jgi:outer membrane protein assembly factor BamE (lipoprotein component of BamABCDE complex)
MKNIMILFFIFGLFGCATGLSKREFAHDKIKDIVVGKTSQREIYDAFGTPLYHGTRTSDESWWMYIHTTPDNSESLSLYFDKDGRVLDYYYSPFRQSRLK